MAARHTKASILDLAFKVATEAQRGQIAEYIQGGWYVSKVQGLTNSELRSVTLHHEGTGAVAVALPSGKVERPYTGRKALTINLATMSRAMPKRPMRRGVGSY